MRLWGWGLEYKVTIEPHPICFEAASSIRPWPCSKVSEAGQGVMWEGFWSLFGKSSGLGI